MDNFGLNAVLSCDGIVESEDLIKIHSMYLILILIFTSLVTDYGSAETNKDASKEKTPKTDIPPDSLDLSPNLNSLWMYRPAPRTNLPQDEDLNQHLVQNKPPQSLTRLAKTISYGLNPYFHKVYFEPFEKRAKPVTLVGIRKNGQNARQTVYVPNKVASGEIAELQSPFNDISNFWLDELRNR